MSDNNPSDNLPEPPYLLEQDKRKGCLAFVDGSLTYFINRYHKQDLLWSFWHNYATSPYYEDPSLLNEFFPTLTSRQDWVEYSETTIIKDEDVAKREENYPLGYRHLSSRLDFYVTKPEFQQAFLVLKTLGRKQGLKRRTEVQIFGSVRVLLLEEEQFLASSSLQPKTFG